MYALFVSNKILFEIVILLGYLELVCFLIRIAVPLLVPMTLLSKVTLTKVPLRKITLPEIRETLLLHTFELEAAAAELVAKMNIENNAEEVTTKIVKTVDLLQKQMEIGIEFHLSLNPPKYVTEINGKITINYEEIRAMNAEEVPQIEHKEDEK